MKYLYTLLRYYLISDKQYIKTRFKDVFGYELKLTNLKTLTEKMQWLKLNDRTPLHTQCADKYRVREYVEKKIGTEYLIPLIFSTTDVAEINLNSLSDEPVIVKTNHGSGGVIIIKNKKVIDLNQIKEQLRKDLSSNYYKLGREWQYKNIKPKVIVEKLLMTDKGEIPSDYKFFCFNGKPEFIALDTDRFGEHKRFFYDTSWNLLPFFLGAHEEYENYYHGKTPTKTEKPLLLNEMLRLVEVLSADFMFVRVDLYLVGTRIYFGELTFHPNAGFCAFYPPTYDLIYGNKLHLH